MDIITNPDIHKADEIWQRVRPDLNPYPEVRNLRSPQSAEAPAAVPEAPAAATGIVMPEASTTEANWPWPFRAAAPTVATVMTMTAAQAVSPFAACSPVVAAPAAAEAGLAVEVESKTEVLAEIMVEKELEVKTVLTAPAATVPTAAEIKIASAMPSKPSAPAAPPVRETGSAGSSYAAQSPHQAAMSALRTLMDSSTMRCQYYTALSRLAKTKNTRSCILSAREGEKNARHRLNTAYFILGGEYYCPVSPCPPEIFCLCDGLRAAYLFTRESADEYQRASAAVHDRAVASLLEELAGDEKLREMMFLRLLEG